MAALYNPAAILRNRPAHPKWRIYLQIRHGNDLADTAKHDAKKAIKTLSSTTVLTLSLEDCDMVVFYKGSEALFQNAMAKNKIVVRVDYLRECRRAGVLVPVREDHLLLTTADSQPPQSLSPPMVSIPPTHSSQGFSQDNEENIHGAQETKQSKKNAPQQSHPSFNDNTTAASSSPAVGGGPSLLLQSSSNSRSDEEKMIEGSCGGTLLSCTLPSKAAATNETSTTTTTSNSVVQQCPSNNALRYRPFLLDTEEDGGDEGAMTEAQITETRSKTSTSQTAACDEQDSELDRRMGNERSPSQVQWNATVIAERSPADEEKGHTSESTEDLSVATTQRLRNPNSIVTETEVFPKTGPAIHRVSSTVSPAPPPALPQHNPICTQFLDDFHRPPLTTGTSPSAKAEPPLRNEAQERTHRLPVDIQSNNNNNTNNRVKRSREEEDNAADCDDSEEIRSKKTNKHSVQPQQLPPHHDIPAPPCEPLRMPVTSVRCSISGGTETERSFVTDIIANFGIACDARMFGRVPKPTHLIVLGAPTTPKILLARVLCIPMLTMQWVTDSMQFGALIEPTSEAHFHAHHLQGNTLPVATYGPYLPQAAEGRADVTLAMSPSSPHSARGMSSPAAMTSTAVALSTPPGQTLQHQLTTPDKHRGVDENGGVALGPTGDGGTISSSSSSSSRRRSLQTLEHHRRELTYGANSHAYAVSIAATVSTLLAPYTIALLGKSSYPPNDVYMELLKSMGATLFKGDLLATLSSSSSSSSFAAAVKNVSLLIEMDGGVERHQYEEAMRISKQDDPHLNEDPQQREEEEDVMEGRGCSNDHRLATMLKTVPLVGPGWIVDAAYYRSVPPVAVHAVSRMSPPRRMSAGPPPPSVVQGLAVLTSPSQAAATASTAARLAGSGSSTAGGSAMTGGVVPSSGVEHAATSSTTAVVSSTAVIGMQLSPMAKTMKGPSSAMKYAE